MLKCTKNKLTDEWIMIQRDGYCDKAGMAKQLLQNLNREYMGIC